MTTWIALLRGVNIGGHHPLPMKTFSADLEAAGFSSVRTYIQSGNVVLRSASASPDRIAKRITDVIHRKYGFTPKILVLTAQDLARAAKSNPFPRAVGEPKSLHVFFLDKKPAKSDLAAMNRLKSANESFVLEGKVLYLHSPAGLAPSKLAAGIERHLGVDATGRNWRTVSTLLDMVRHLD